MDLNDYFLVVSTSPSFINHPTHEIALSHFSNCERQSLFDSDVYLGLV